MGKHTLRSERVRLVGEWRASGLSQAAFAERRGLVLGSFRRWVRDERSEDVAVSGVARFVEVRAAEGAGHGRSVGRLELGDGLVLELSEWPEPSYVAELRRALVRC